MPKRGYDRRQPRPDDDTPGGDGHRDVGAGRDHCDACTAGRGDSGANSHCDTSGDAYDGTMGYGHDERPGRGYDGTMGYGHDERPGRGYDQPAGHGYREPLGHGYDEPSGAGSRTGSPGRLSGHRSVGHRDRDGRRAGGVPDGLLLGLLGLILGLSVLAWTGTGLAGLLSHGAWPTGVTFSNTPVALRHLVTAPHDLAGAWPATPPGQLSGYGLFWGLLIGQLLVLIVLTIFVLGVVTRWRLVRTRAREERRAARAREERRHGLAREEHRHGRAAHRVPHPAPETAHPATHRAAAPSASPDSRQAVGTSATHAPSGAPAVQAQHRTPEGAGTEQPPAVVTSPAVTPQFPVTPVYHRAAQRLTAVQAVLDAPGPALVLTSDPTLWEETKDARAKLGPVLLYDPEHRCDSPSRLHWSPTAGCENPATAAARAAALLTPVRPQARMDAAVAETAETLLRSWLHAAAVDGRPFKQLLRWAQNAGTGSGSGSQEAVRILRTHPKAQSGAAGLLESALTAYPERREQAQQLAIRAFSALSSVHVREACTPNRTDSLTLESFADEGGTLYVVGEAIEDPRTRPTGPGAMPLLTALASHVVEHGRRMAARSSDGRLDPPMTLVLDDVAAVAPLPQLPELLTAGQGQGLPTLALLRSQEQFNSRWSQDR